MLLLGYYFVFRGKSSHDEGTLRENVNERPADKSPEGAFKSTLLPTDLSDTFLHEPVGAKKTACERAATSPWEPTPSSWFAVGGLTEELSWRTRGGEAKLHREVMATST